MPPLKSELLRGQNAVVLEMGTQPSLDYALETCGRKLMGLRFPTSLESFPGLRIRMTTDLLTTEITVPKTGVEQILQGANPPCQEGALEQRSERRSGQGRIEAEEPVTFQLLPTRWWAPAEQ